MPRQPPTDLTGRAFGQLTVLQFSHTTIPENWPKQRVHFWLCHCSCGTDKAIRATDLLSGKVTSCRCKQKQIIGSLNRTHGDTGSAEYLAWKDMHKRCSNSKVGEYHRYGGRGISVCKHWSGKDGYQHFLEDMGRMPDGYQLDRKNNDGNYSPSNCCWSTRKIQCRNKGNNRLLTYQGKTQTVIEWAEEIEICNSTLYARLHRGWSVVRTLSTPTVKSE